MTVALTMEDEAQRSPPPAHDVTGLLLAWRRGDRAAFEQLVPLVYEELRRLAHGHLRGERHQTLQTADLVHETYVRLVDSSRVQWQNRAHFFAMAARCMRRILVDAARARQALKRGGDYTRVDLDADLTVTDAPKTQAETPTGGGLGNAAPEPSTGVEGTSAHYQPVTPPSTGTTATTVPDMPPVTKTTT